MEEKYRVKITYCPKCNWMLRSAWFAQEILYTFGGRLSEVALCPSEIGGEFLIQVEENAVWERKRDGGFPDVKELKQRIRDIIEPHRDLGHLDRSSSPAS